MGNTVGIGIIGCGGRIRGISRRTCKQDKRLRVVGVCDISPDSIEATKAFYADSEYYAHADKALAVYDSPEALVADPEISWVMVGSWNHVHCEHVVAAFEAGKHVFCEKPLATSVEDCVKMRDAWKASGKQFAIGFTLRFSPHYRKIKELLDAGIVGEIISMEFNETLAFNHGGYIHDDWRSETKYAGTHLLEKCSHDVDLVNWMIGSRASRVASFGGLNFFLPENEHHMQRLGTNKDGKRAYMAMGHHNHPDAQIQDSNPFTRKHKDIVDNQVAIIEYKNDVRVTFHTNCNSAIPERRMYICGTEGTIRADVIMGLIQSQRIGFDTELVTHETGAKGGHGGGDDVLSEEIKDCMLKGSMPAAGLEDGLASAVTCFGIDQANALGEVVDMEPLWDQAGVQV